jgi:hypothetical protein
MPAWQAFVGVQASPAVQPTQVPLLQTMFVPHAVPLATFADSTHTAAPLVQETVPVRQGLLVTGQVAPAVQLVQVPVALQTALLPQDVPAVTSVPLSVQTGVPVAHESVPW